MNLIPETVIVINPVHTILARKPNPKWTCKHIGITVVSKEHMIYQCTKCCPHGNIRVLPKVATGTGAAAEVKG
jgi:hypothetical protein